MSIPHQTQPGARYWPVPVARAIPALAAAAVITFSADHSATFGLLVFGGFAIASGLIVGILSWYRMSRGTSRALAVSQAAISVVAGVLALLMHAGGLGFFLYLVSMWAALTGFLELYSGFRVRPQTTGSRDWLFTGAFTAILAIVFLFIQADPVLAVGLVGAYGVILGVYLIIAGLSLKWAPQQSATGSAAAPTGVFAPPASSASTRSSTPTGAETETEIVQ